MQSTILENQNDTSPDTLIIEDILLDNLTENLKSESFLQLPISTIYRILSKYEKTHEKQQYQTEILNFIFKCLDKHGRNASPLIKLVEFNCDNLDYFERLITQYSDIVDFHFLNSSFITMIHQIQTQYNSIKNENAQLKSQIIKLKEENETINQANDELTKKQIEYVKKLDQLTKLNDQLKEKLQNESFEIGEVVCTSKKLSKDESWLECNGKNISQIDYPDLFDVLQSNPKSEWQEQIIDIPDNNDNTKIEDLKCSSLTNGEFIIYTIFKEEENKTYLSIYSKRRAKDSWKKMILDFPKGKVGKWCKMKYVKNEFLIFILLLEETTFNLYSVHSNNPENGWKMNSNFSIDTSSFSFIDYYITDFNYINSMYVVTFCGQNTKTKKVNSFIAYGSNIFSKFNLNMNFCDQNSRYDTPFITYGNNKWILCLLCEFDSCIYTSDDISTLSTDSQKNIYYHGNSTKCFFNIGCIFKDEQVIIACISDSDIEDEMAIFYSHINENYSSFNQKMFPGRYSCLFSPLFYFGRKFYFFCPNYQEDIKLYYSNEKNLEEWEQTQISTKQILVYYGYIFSVVVINNNMFCTFALSNSQFLILSNTFGSIKQLPENTEAKNLTAYIKAKK